MINKYSHLSVNMKLAFALCLFIWTVPHTVAGNADAEKALLTFNQHHTMLPPTSDKPLLQIFANGQVEVHRPAYLQDAGDFQLQLSPTELAQLISRLQALNLNEFDAQKTTQQISQLERASTGANGRTMHAWSDHTRTTLWLSYLTDTNSNKRQPLQWSNVGGDAKRYPQLQALQNLATAEQTLMQLVWHKNLGPLTLSGNMTDSGESK